jgi:hypothetical protein
MEDRLTPTKLLKDWQQLMLGMREDQILFHHLILGRLCRAKTNVYKRQERDQNGKACGRHW